MVGGSGSVTVSDTPPSSPSSGDLWYKSDEGQLKVWYQDGTSNQWVDTSNNAGGGGGSSSSGANVSVSDTPPTKSITSEWRFMVEV